TQRNKLMFDKLGVYTLVDGQYGSTGKGVIASYLAEYHGNKVQRVLTNAGPNSGHTFWFGDEQYVLKQLPVMGVYKKIVKNPCPISITNGAIVNWTILNDEIKQFDLDEWIDVAPGVAMIYPRHKVEDHATEFSIASTGQGVG